MSEYSPSIQRFTGFADTYSKYRPTPPTALAEILCRLAQTSNPELVIDLGCGTGLSTRYWSDRAKQVIGIDSSPDMLAQANEIEPIDNVTYRQGVSHDTDIPDRAADIVTCSQALHWMEPLGTFREAKRILRVGGVFAAYDFDWPPHTLSWEVSLAYAACMENVHRFEEANPDTPKQLPKSEHLTRMKESECFRFRTEMVIHHKEQGNADRIVGVLLSQGSVSGLLKKGVSEKDLGIDELRETADRILGDIPQSWYWSSRLRIGIV